MVTSFTELCQISVGLFCGSSLCHTTVDALYPVNVVLHSIERTTHGLTSKGFFEGHNLVRARYDTYSIVL